jgi:hypothetical protein
MFVRILVIVVWSTFFYVAIEVLKFSEKITLLIAFIAMTAG